MGGSAGRSACRTEQAQEHRSRQHASQPQARRDAAPDRVTTSSRGSRGRHKHTLATAQQPGEATQKPMQHGATRTGATHSRDTHTHTQSSAATHNARGIGGTHALAHQAHARATAGGWQLDSGWGKGGRGLGGARGLRGPRPRRGSCPQAYIAPPTPRGRGRWRPTGRASAHDSPTPIAGGKHRCRTRGAR